MQKVKLLQPPHTQQLVLAGCKHSKSAQVCVQVGADLHFEGPANQRRGRADSLSKIMFQHQARTCPTTLQQLLEVAAASPPQVHHFLSYSGAFCIAASLCCVMAGAAGGALLAAPADWQLLLGDVCMFTAAWPMQGGRVLLRGPFNWRLWYPTTDSIFNMKGREQPRDKAAVQLCVFQSHIWLSRRACL